MAKKSSSKKQQARRATSGIFGIFSQNQLSEFKQAFEFIDFNKDGYIDRRDVVAAFDSLGRNYPDEQIDEMIAEGNGQINFAMFITLIGEKILGHDSEEQLRSSLSKFDMYDKGKVNKQYLVDCLRKYGDKMTDEEIDDVLQYAQLQRANEIDIDFFVKAICGSLEDD